ncbi:hypothetical protein EDD36DRAFT_437228 [Exophiala viscosa]|uniref:Calponin-homology (CH) domain-containing protein n=1 Tax=Exophiala viscosa TaxID=2486360 RepID=A0AAN6DUR7_9EURO|nr:hypothetical protein EDD36DRAFT_437228 [Exophiala viscosa]
MFRGLSGTPCPVPTSASPLPSFDDDITATTTIEFTSVFNASGSLIRDTKPRRLRNAAGSVVKPRKGDNIGAKFAIHEDVSAAAESRKNDNCQPSRRCTMISQPPQRPRTKKRGTVIYEATEDVPKRVSVSLPRPGDFNEQKLPIPSSTTKRGQSQSQSHTMAAAGSKLNMMPRRPPTSSKLQEDLTIALPDHNEPTTVLKPPRRGTIYIPNEDTTMPSMYMGIFSPIKHASLNPVAEVQPQQSGVEAEMDIEITGIAAQMAAKKKARARLPRDSMITLSPKRGRGPLQMSQRNVQEAVIQEDRVGSGPGKENVPPGQDRLITNGKNIDKSVASTRNNMGAPAHEVRASTLFQQTASSSGRQAEKKTLTRNARPVWKAPTNIGAHIKNAQAIHEQAWATASTESHAAREPQIVAKKPSVPSRFVIPSLKSEMMIDVAYPLLTDDLACPAMYEDNWLSHQEVAITQLVNNLFAATSQTSESGEDGSMFRIRLLEMYGSAENEVLYKRLQAGLLYGALSVPSEVLKGVSRLSTDLGKRNAFIDLWLDTYDLTHLRAAMEVVVGRQCSTGARENASRRSMRQFMEAFLIHNEDGKSEFYTEGREAWSYHRTLLRSMMVIKILDMTKTTALQVVSGSLFRPSSNYKTSAGVVRALFQLLNPSAGDPIRALSHIGYNVTHEQYPLEEYTYQVDNLAVDLRDGVRLTRLVELLLYPFASGMLDHADSTTTVVLPTGEELSLVEGQTQWPLSQHLKFPCISRAAKLYNVQITLSALQGVKGMGGLVQNVQAEDIVDGFREKTVKLLWGLTSKWGLGALIDCRDVEREIKRLCRVSGKYDNDFFHAIGDDDEHDHMRYKSLLKAWAQAVASTKGLVVKNLTTSFADGRVFEAIVDEYEGYNNHQNPLAKGQQQLSGRLRRLGCSEQFSGLFATGQESQRCTHVFDRDFVLAALAFLCSRLLGPTRGARAAVTIQRAWRSHWDRIVAARRRCLKTVAQGCAEAVTGREKNQDDGNADGAQKFSRMVAAVSQEEDLWLNL